ncbi:MAG: outer membrane lipoprotein carrier protein LolA [Desulfobacteraceae bacterium]|nr:outer membrane lipoprotein carrier protein LolA [Desulfobacteraceae bacterium]
MQSFSDSPANVEFPGYRSRRHYCSGLILLTLLLQLLSPAAFAQDNSASDLEALLTGIENRYSGKDFTATFFQRSRLAAIDITETAQGKAFFSHPGKMRWEYLEPEKHKIITNGETLWIFRPEDNQVVQGEARTFFKAGAGGAFLSDIRLVRESYTITLERNDKGVAELILVPKQENPEISTIKIRLFQDTFKIDRVETTNIYGDTTTLEFMDIDFRKLDPSLFDFVVPKGTDLLFMNG